MVTYQVFLLTIWAGWLDALARPPPCSHELIEVDFRRRRVIRRTLAA
jgi:hypothetical protein